MGKFGSWDTVADSIDVGVARQALVVDLDAKVDVIFDSGLLKA